MKRKHALKFNNTVVPTSQQNYTIEISIDSDRTKKCMVRTAMITLVGTRVLLPLKNTCEKLISRDFFWGGAKWAKTNVCKFS